METKKILAATAILILIPVGLSQQASNSFIPDPGFTPNNPFYSIDKVSERIELAVGSAPVIGSQELEAKIRANHAAERLAEAEKMMEKNRTEKAEKLFKKYSQQMNKSEEKAGNATKIKERLANVTERQTQKLKQIKQKVPEQARKGIQTAIDANKNRMKENPPGKPENPGARRGNKPPIPPQGESSSKGAEKSQGAAPDNGSKKGANVRNNGSSETGEAPGDKTENSPNRSEPRDRSLEQDDSSPGKNDRYKDVGSSPGVGVASY